MTVHQEAHYAHAWTPDWQVVDAVEAGRARLTNLDHADRAVTVATLTHRGRSVADIAEQLDCCTRVVKRIRAEPLTAALAPLLDAEQRADQAERHAHHQTAVYARTTVELEADRDRYRRQARDLYQALTHRKVNP